MAKQRNILYDPRYEKFRERYYDNLPLYVLECCRYTPTWQQMEFLKEAGVPGARVAVSSGHGTGKSFCLAWLLDWHLRVFTFSNAILTATNIEQARSVTWKYLEATIIDVEDAYPWMKGFFVKETKRYYAKPYKDSWYILPKTASKDKPENMAGQHNENLLVCVDEASGVADVIHDVMRGALTQERNKYIMTSQFTRPVGHFAEAMTKLNKKLHADGIYLGITMNSELSPIVSRKFIMEKLVEYGGHHSPEYQIRVLGLPPDNMSGYLIPQKWCEDCQKFTIKHEEDWGYVLVCDVSEGVHRDSSVANLFKVSGHGDNRKAENVWCEEFLDKNEKEFGRYIASKYHELPALSIYVDADGSGRTVILDLEEMGVPCGRIHWGLPCHTSADQKRYFNQRAYAHCKLREAIFTRRFKGPASKKFVEQASRIPYKIDERGRYQMTPKDQMKAKGIKSPDISDTCCFVFLSEYIPANEGQDTATEKDYYLELARAALGED